MPINRSPSAKNLRVKRVTRKTRCDDILEFFLSSLWNYEQRYSTWSVYKRCCRPDVEQTRQQSTRVRLEWFGRIVNDRILETIVWHTLYGGCTRTSRLCKTDFIMSLFFYVYNLRVRTEYSNRAFRLRPIGVCTQIVYWPNWGRVVVCPNDWLTRNFSSNRGVKDRYAYLSFCIADEVFCVPRTVHRFRFSFKTKAP